VNSPIYESVTIRYKLLRCRAIDVGEGRLDDSPSLVFDEIVISILAAGSSPYIRSPLEELRAGSNSLPCILARVLGT
jgi:hypothetical protein